MLMVSFMAVPIKNKPLTPAKATPSKPSATIDHPNNSGNSAWTGLDHKAVNVLNQSDSGWAMPENNLTYKVEVPVNDIAIDLSDLMIAQPVHAQTHTQIYVNKRFKLRKHGKKHIVKHLKFRKHGKKHVVKYLKHRKKVTKHGKQHIAKHFKYRKKAAKHDNKHAVKHFKHRKKVASRFKKHRL